MVATTPVMGVRCAHHGVELLRREGEGARGVHTTQTEGGGQRLLRAIAPGHLVRPTGAGHHVGVARGVDDGAGANLVRAALIDQARAYDPSVLNEGVAHEGVQE